jgi:hypothetical protein
MATPFITSGLNNEAQAPNSNQDAPSGRPILIAGPAGKGPTEPQVIRDADTAYDIYGTEGDLADDVALALLGAEFGAGQAGSNQLGRVIAVRTETGTAASKDLKKGGTTVLSLHTDASGTQANQWRVTPKDSSLQILDPENGEELTFQFDPSGATSSIRTPSQLASAIRSATGGRLVAEVERDHAHFEFSLDANEDLSTNGLAYESDNAETVLDFSSASSADLAALTSESTTRIGGDTNHFDQTTPEPVHNRIVPSGQDVDRFYAITAGKARVLPEDQQEVRLDNLGDASRIATDTGSLLNISTESGTLGDAAKRDGSTVSEAWDRVRESYVGRLDTSLTSDLTDDSWSDVEVQAATDADISGDLGADNAGLGSIYDDQSGSLVSGNRVLVFGQGSETDGVYTVAENSGSLYLENDRYRTGETLSGNGVLIDVLNGPNNSGLKLYDSAEGTIVNATKISFDFEAPHGIADEESGAGTLAAAYANWFEGDATNADRLSVDRLTPEDHERFEVDGGPLTIYLAPVTAPEEYEEFEGSYKVDWSDQTATIHFDSGDVQSQYDDALVYVSFDSCVYDLQEKTQASDLNTEEDFFVDGQTLRFGQPLEHQTVVRSLRVTQYRRGNDVELARVEGGNKLTFEGRDNQPGPGGKAIGDIETVFGFEYDFEPDFPPAGTPETLSGATSGVNASEQVKAQALEQALKTHAKRDHDFVVASGLHVDAMQGARDPVTGEKVYEPVGVLSVLDRHQRRQSETGASPIVYASVRPMQPSTMTGRFSNEQKRQRVKDLVEPSGNNTASIIDSASRPETFIFDSPMEVSLGGRTVRTSSPALWAGLRSTLPNTAALYKTDLAGALTPIYKYDVAGEGMTDRLSESSINAWSAKRNSAQLADERTAAKKKVGANGELVETGFKSGVALLAAKEFQQDAVDQLESLLGPVPSGGAEVLRGTVETMLSGIAQRTNGVQQLIFNAQRDIQIRSEGGNSLGMTISLTLQVNGELRRIELTVGAVNQATAESDNEPAIPTAQ